ncbi:hypothetical protein ATCCB_0029 [Lactobacillus phage ATCCB]|nr:hypothetical protein ATCCB_0029 [Lactobacillus phage ATCCB]
MATVISMHAKENVDTMGLKQMVRVFAWMTDDNHVRMIKYLDNVRISDETHKIVLGRV